MAVASMGMVQSATVFYQFILVLIWAIQYVLVYGLLPLANGYVFLVLVNYIAKEDVLMKMAELFHRFIGWTLKAMIGLVVGFNVIQGMVAPAMDSFQTAVLNKTMSAVPGVGNAAGAITELLVGSGALIKNGLGAAGLLVILYICLSPMIKILVFTGAYRLVGACMQPVADRRILGGVNGVAEGGTLLFRMMFTAALLLLLTIAILAVATGRTG
jgi:stage III sporulation protein AE